jgi:hypothetical protein
VNYTLNFLYHITLGLILCCPFFLISLIFATLGIDFLNIIDNYFIFMEGNSGNYSSGQAGNTFGGSGGSFGSGGPLGENNNSVPLSSDNYENKNENENQQVNSSTEELQDQWLKECMASKLSRYRLANAHLRDVYLDDSFTSAEHEYIADKIFQDKEANALISGPTSHRTNCYARYVQGHFPERRYVGKVTRNFITNVFYN